MKNIKVLSLFAGIGAPEKALRNIGVEYDLVGFSEIDKNAVEAYSLIHGVDKSLNLGDIRNIKVDVLPEFDLLLAGFPCTDISNNGKQKGFKDTDTDSGLVNYAIDIISLKKPKIVLFENVKNLVSKKFIEDFKIMISNIEKLGYKCHFKLLNSKDFGVPHNRERVYMVFIRNDQNIDFNFEFSERKCISLYEILEKDDCIDNIQDATKEKIMSQFKSIEIIDAEINDKSLITKDKVICLNSKNKEGNQPSQQYRVYSKKGLITTISSQLNGRYNVVSKLGHIRKITPREAYILQGFTEDDFEKVKHISPNSLYSQAGNTITVPVLEEIFKKIFSNTEGLNKYNELSNLETLNNTENELSYNASIRLEDSGQLTFDLI